MRISTPQTYDRALNGMLDNQAALSKTQMQLSEGKRILNPSDDPVAISIAENLKTQIANSKQFIKNGDAAEVSLNVAENALSGVTKALNRVRELLLQGQNGTLSADDRKSLAIEVARKKEQIEGLANTQLSDGSYVFSGYQTHVRPFSQDITGTTIYNGDQGVRHIDINASVTVQSNLSGSDIFTDIKTGNNTFVTKAAASNTGSGVISKGSLVDAQGYTASPMEIVFETNGSGNLAYRITDQASGTVLVPEPPLTAPASSPSYHEGTDIDVRGVKFKISGHPIAGDSFTVEPSARQDIFATLDTVVEGLRSSADGDSLQAAQRNQLENSLLNLDRAMENIDAQRSKIGANLNVIESEKSINQDTALQAETTLSNVQDLDYSTAITELNKRSVALQAAQQSFVKIEGLSLFKFIG